jgi:hypothetical protein
MILGAWLERVLDQPLDQAFANRVAWPLGLDGGPVPRLGFHRLAAARGPSSSQQGRVVPTEVYDPALHPAGAPTWFACRRPATVAHYEVHDDNAFVMGGVVGHAGLFGDAAAVFEVAHAWLVGGLPGLAEPVRRAFLSHLSEVPGSTRRLGWDSPSPDGSGSAGSALSSAAAGHADRRPPDQPRPPHPRQPGHLKNSPRLPPRRRRPVTRWSRRHGARAGQRGTCRIVTGVVSASAGTRNGSRSSRGSTATVNSTRSPDLLIPRIIR